MIILHVGSIFSIPIETLIWHSSQIVLILYCWTTLWAYSTLQLGSRFAVRANSSLAQPVLWLDSGSDQLRFGSVNPTRPGLGSVQDFLIGLSLLGVSLDRIKLPAQFSVLVMYLWFNRLLPLLEPDSALVRKVRAFSLLVQMVQQVCSSVSPLFMRGACTRPLKHW